MHGNNPARPQEFTDGSSLWVQSIFYTLQGEGPFTGEPAIFIRLGGCNLKCYWCDTDFESSAWNPTLDELLQKIESESSVHCKLAVITGGEPFRQNIEPLVTSLLEKGLRVQIETNGTLWVDLPKHEQLHIVCSPKTSRLHEKIAPRINSFKYVISETDCDSPDGLPISSTQSAGRTQMIARPTNNSDVYVMPLDTGNPDENARNTKACVDIALRFGYKVTLQTHKILDIE